MRHLLAVVALFGLAGGAWAQAARNPPDSPEGTLSDKLDKSDGVVKPPDIDPNMKTAPPHEGAARTPVIPPPQEKDGRKIDPK